jgi:hypothetical protein
MLFNRDKGKRPHEVSIRLDGLDTLESRIRKLEAAADDQRAALASLGPLSDRLVELRMRQERAEERAQMLETAVADTRRGLDEQSEVLDLVRVTQVAERADLTREDFLVHYELAQRLRALYTQRIPDLIQPRLTAERPRDVVRRQAQLISGLCLVLFGPDEEGGLGEPDLAELARIATDAGVVGLDARHQRLLERVGTEAAHLFRAMTGSGHASHFDFAVEPGAPADPEEHVLWPSCEAGRPVAFVVCPGYRAADRRLLETFVYTEAEG